MSGFWTALITIFTAIIGVAVVAVVVSKNANTSSVIDSAFGGLAVSLNAATAPVTSASNSGFGSLTLGFPGSGIGFSNI